MLILTLLLLSKFNLFESSIVGLQFEKLPFYENRDGTFKCLSTKSIVPHHNINDDYCDCEDGTDEPGTSACVNGQFFCQNKGFLGKSITSIWVNDGVCDCCDGSDEYKGLVNCSNTCKEEGRIFVNKLKTEIQTNQMGHKRKQEQIASAIELKKEHEKRYNELLRQKDALEQEYTKILSVKDEIEKKENDAKSQYLAKLGEIKAQLKEEENKKKSATLFSTLDRDMNGIISADEIETHLIPMLPPPRINNEINDQPSSESKQDNSNENISSNETNETEEQKNENAEHVSYCDKTQDFVVDDKDILPLFTHWKSLKMDMNTFYEHVSQRLSICHPHAYEKTHESIKEEPKPAETNDNLNSHKSPTQIHDIGENEIPTPEKFDPDDYNEDGHVTTDHREDHDETDHINEEDDDVEDMNGASDQNNYQHNNQGEILTDILDNTEQPDILPYDEPTKHLISEANKIRQNYEDIRQKQTNLDNEYKNVRNFLESDMGPHLEFLHLRDHCYEYRDERGEYVYKLCPFKDAIQESISSHSQTNMGRWQGFLPNEHDPNDKYAYMKFTNGQQCWNGPQRSTKVKMICGVEDMVISVSEPSRCEYYMEFLTPAKCIPIEQRKDLHPYINHFRDEL